MIALEIRFIEENEHVFGHLVRAAFRFALCSLDRGEERVNRGFRGIQAPFPHFGF